MPNDHVVLNKAKDKMAAKAKIETSLPKLFSQLQLAGEDGDYEWGLDVIKEILKLAPDDHDALTCKVICLIQMSEFQEALKLIDHLSKPPGDPNKYLYEKAYCLYKQSKYDTSLQLLDQLSPEDRTSVKVLDLRSQINYHLEKYEESAEGFQKGSLQIDNNERTANMAASLSYCNPSTVEAILSSTPVNEITLEQCFNLATTYLLATQDFKKAEDLLRKAEKLCEALENPEEEDSEQELIPVHIQLAYTLQMLGRNEEAMSLYSSVLKQKPSSALQTLTAANNVIVLNGDKDIFDSKKKIKLLMNETAIKKLNTRQQQIVLYNRCLFALCLNQLEQSRQLLAELKSKYPNTDLTVSAEAALLYREKKTSECTSLLEQYIVTQPNGSLNVYLMLAQVYMNQSNVNKVREVLEKVPNLAQYLGVVSTLVHQCKATGDIDGCMRVLDKVFKWWRSRKEAPTETRLKVLWEIALYKLQHGHPEAAADVLEHLCQEDPSNVRYLANLIAAYSRFDPKKAEELGQTLPKLSTSSSVDVDSLEHMPTFRNIRKQAPVKYAAAAGGTSEEPPVEKKKKKRKKKLPKNYDPSKPPDPERWLPLRERSYYRKSKKKGHSAVGRGTQGMSASMAAMASKLDASKPKPLEEGSGKDDIISPRAKSQPQKKPQSQQRRKKKGKR